MKRRPGLKGGIGLAELQRTKEAALKAAYVTYNFEKNVAEPMYNSDGDEIYANTMATRAGFYFEACFYKAFCQLNGQSFSESELNTNQKQAVYNFNNARLKPGSDPDIMAQVKKLGEAVEQSAALAAKMQYDSIMKKLQKEADKKRTIPVKGEINLPSIEIKNIAVDDTGLGNVLGDMKIIINGEEHIVELKWQSSSTRATRYFGPVSDSTLFNGGFAAWLRDRKATYWTMTEEESYWSDKIAFEALPRYMNDRFGNAGAMINYLLGKGNITDSYNAVFNKAFSTKSVIHANYTGITMQGLPQLAERLRNAVEGVSIGTRIKEAIVFLANGGEEAATFGLTTFRNKRNVKSENSPGPEVFSFQFYIAQKYVGMMPKK